MSDKKKLSRLLIKAKRKESFASRLSTYGVASLGLGLLKIVQDSKKEDQVIAQKFKWLNKTELLLAAGTPARSIFEASTSH